MKLGHPEVNEKKKLPVVENKEKMTSLVIVILYFACPYPLTDLHPLPVKITLLKIHFCALCVGICWWFS